MIGWDALKLEKPHRDSGTAFQKSVLLASSTGLLGSTTEKRNLLSAPICAATTNAVLPD